MLIKIFSMILVRNITFIFLILLSNAAVSQTTFNKRFHFDYPDIGFTSLVATDSCYYVTGAFADSITPFTVGNIFIKFDLNGQAISHNVLKNPLKTYQTIHNTLRQTPDNNLVLSGIAADSIMKSLFIKFTPNGDTIFTREFPNYFEPGLFMMPTALVVTDSGYFMVNQAVNPVGNPPNTDISIVALNHQGEEQWHKAFGSNLIDRPASIIADDDGFIIGAWRWNRNLTNQFYTAQNYIFKIDSLGNQKWEYLSSNSQLLHRANDIVKTPDGGLVIASGKGTEIPLASVNYIYWEIYIRKLNANRQVEWEVEFDNQVATENVILRQLLSLKDESGYVAAGNLWALPEDGGGMVGTLVKVSPNGQKLWTRLYRYATSTGASHQIFDARETADNGFILCGLAEDPSLASQRRQGWLLKVDQHGCLVPGCHLINNVDEQQSNIKLSIYPNPTSDFLNIYFRSPQKNNGQFRIINIAGLEMQRFEAHAQEMTHIVPVDKYPQGVYYLQYIDEAGKLKGTETFVVEK